MRDSNHEAEYIIEQQASFPIFLRIQRSASPGRHTPENMSPLLLLVIFVVELFIAIVNSIGATAINGLVRLTRTLPSHVSVRPQD